MVQIAIKHGSDMAIPFYFYYVNLHANGQKHEG